jgi:hypothetical protein
MLETPQWHVFFDTSAIYSMSDYVNVALFTGPHVHHVSELCVEELAVQLVNDKEGITQAYKTFKRFEHVVGLVLPPLSSNADLLNYFRAEINAKLRQKGCKTFAAFSHDPAEQLALFTERHHGGYKDTMILASSIRYAAENGIKHCGFVVEEQKDGFEGFAKVAKILEEKYQVRTTFLRKNDLENTLKITPTQIEEIKKLLMPKLHEKLLSMRRQLVDQALSSESVFGPTFQGAISQFRERFKSLDADLSSINAGVVDVTPFLHGLLKKSGTISVGIRMVVRFHCENLLARLYDAIGEAKIKYDGTSFSDAHVSSIDPNWNHPMG